MNQYQCPLCESELVECKGNSIHPGDERYGVTLYCSSVKCPAQEVMGHGDKVKDAWGVIQAKFISRENRE